MAGGVPCPPFSQAGKQLGSEDERDLFPEAIRLIGEIQPRAVMLENVRGLLDPKFTEYRTSILQRIADLGYRVQIKLLNASDYGVPQLRPRVIIVGIRNNENGEFHYPEEHPENAKTVGETLLDLMKANGWHGAAKWAKEANSIAPTILGTCREARRSGSLDLSGQERHGKHSVLTDSEWRMRRLQRISRECRLTPRMIARIQGFPDTWDFGSKKTHACRMIGNAFPPPVAKAVGEEIRRVLEGGSVTD